MSETAPAPTLPQTVYGATAFSAYNLSLDGELWPNSTSRSSWALDYTNNNPRLVVWSRNPLEETKTDIRGKKLSNVPVTMFMGMYDLFKIVQLLNEYRDKSEPGRKALQFRGRKRLEDGSLSESETEIVAVLEIGRDPDGFLFLAVTPLDRQRIKMRFKNNPWVAIHDDSGLEISNEEGSNRSALAFTTAIMTLIGPIAAANFVVIDRKPKKEAFSFKPQPTTTPVEW